MSTSAALHPPSWHAELALRFSRIAAATRLTGNRHRGNAIKWSVVERMIWAWILTIPAAGGIAYLLIELLRVLGWT